MKDSIHLIIFPLILQDLSLFNYISKEYLIKCPFKVCIKYCHLFVHRTSICSPDIYLSTGHLFVHRTSICPPDIYLFTGHLFVHRTSICPPDIYLFTGHLFVHRTSICSPDIYLSTGHLFVHRTSICEQCPVSVIILVIGTSVAMPAKNNYSTV